MNDLAVHAGLFASAFASATLLPGSSEAALVALIVLGRSDIGLLVATATAGNVLGSLVNWFMGRFLSRFRDRRWFPVDRRNYERAIAWYSRYGLWSLLFAWLPVIGDPLTVVAGALRADLCRFLVLVTIGKAARYLFIAAALGWRAGGAG
jgi:membrane protein YqaA with SNARE-associated domain